MPDEKKTRSIKKQSQDQDLTAIDHIDESIQSWFYNTLNIRSYCQLSNSSVKMISEAAKRDGRVLPVTIIKKMIAEAKRLDCADQSTSDIESSRVHNDPSYVNSWGEYATFVVYLERKEPENINPSTVMDKVRITAHHIETGEQRTWPGINVQNVCLWLGEHLNKIETSVCSESVAQYVKHDESEFDTSITVNDVIIRSDLAEFHDQYIVENDVPKVYAIYANKIYFILLNFTLLNSNFVDKLNNISVRQRQYNLYDESIITSESKMENIMNTEKFTYSGTIRLNSLSKGVYKVDLILQYSLTFQSKKRIDAGVVHVL